VEPKLDELKATALLGRLNQMSTAQNEYEGPPEGKPRVNRADMMWALKKESAYKEVHGCLPNAGADLLLGMLADLNQKKVAWGDPPQEDVWQTLEKFDFALDRAELWLKAMGTLMSRQIELGVESIEEVAHAMACTTATPPRSSSSSSPSLRSRSKRVWATPRGRTL
jgi:hypothetical protein